MVSLVAFSLSSPAQKKYDLLLKGGYVIDPRNGINGVRDVAISNGVIQAVEPNIAPETASKVVDVSGLYVTPGLIDIHVHVYSRTGVRNAYTGDFSVDPDSFSFRSCTTTMVDAGSSGWRNFPDFLDRVIDRSRTRVLAFVNIVGLGMAGEVEQDIQEMDPKGAAEVVKRYREYIVGIKTAHYQGPEWTAVERAVRAGELAGVPVMVDFGQFRPERPFEQLVLEKLRPGDIYTHTYLAAVPMLDEQGRVRRYLFEAQKRGVKFDVGHGAGSFVFRQAVPAIRQGFLPDSISTDLHTGSMNAGMKDMLNVMSKFLNMGLSLEDVILRSTWNPAQQIRRPDLGHLSVGAPADIAVLRLEEGQFGFVDVFGARLRGTKKLTCELTLREGLVVWDLNGLTREDWDKLPKDYDRQSDPTWDGTLSRAPIRRR